MMGYMDEALKEAYEGIRNGHGGPFGSVVVKDGKPVAIDTIVISTQHSPEVTQAQIRQDMIDG